MYLSLDVCWILGVVFLLAIIFSLVVLLFINDIKGVAKNKGIKIGIEKGLGKPIENIEEVERVLGGKNIRVLIFISERHCGLFLAETMSNDITGEGLFYCKIERWSTSDNDCWMLPKTGKNYRFSVEDGVALFI